jgi:RNA polymerase sigma-70 factor (ECF subfamily)
MYTEAELIQSVIKGDTYAHRRFVKQYERLVFYVINKLIDNEEDVQDLAQEVFIKVFKNLPKFKAESKLSTWIGQIAYRESVNYLKKRKRFNDYSLADFTINQLTENSQNPESKSISNDIGALVRKAVAQLPERYRHVIVLYHLDEFSYQEISEITEMPEGTVKSYIFRGRKILKDYLSVFLKNEEV